jgi:hypothetical protein
LNLILSRKVFTWSVPVTMSVSSLDPSSLSLGSLRVIRDRSQAKVDQYGHQKESEELDRQHFENY